MTSMYLEIIQLFFKVGSIFALAFGFLLFFDPDRISTLSNAGNKWYSSRKRTKALDIIRDTDSLYFANNRFVGISMLFASVIALYLIYARIPGSESIVIQGVDAESSLGIGILIETLRSFLVLFIILGLLVWGFLAFDPEKLRIFNNKMNRWVSTRLLLLPLERMNTSFDAYILENNRLFGVLIILGSCFILYKFMG